MPFFSSVSSLSKNYDPWEGHWAEDEFQDVIAMFKGMLDLDWVKVTRDAIKKSTLVNCWYRSDYESAAMWTTYGKDGIALKSTVRALKASLEAEERHVGLAAVKYSRQLDDVPPLTQAVFRKRPSFEHEREIRAVIFDPAAQGDGIYANVDLEKLIQAIHVNPLAEPWLRNIVDTEAKRYGLDKSVVRSSLYDPV